MNILLISLFIPIMLFSNEFNTAEFPGNITPPSSPITNSTETTTVRLTNISTNSVTNITLNRQLITVTNITPEIEKIYSTHVTTNVQTNQRSYAPIFNPNQTLEETINLIEAVRSGDLMFLNIMLKKGISPNSQLSNETGDYVNAVMTAVSGRRITVLETLLKYGANPNMGVNHTGIDDITPLMVAAYQGPLEIIDLLLDYGADINARTTGKIQGETPLTSAILSKKPALVDHLLKKGANPNLSVKSKTIKNITPLMLAVENGKKSIVDLILKNNQTRKHDVDSEGKSALIYAYISKNFHLVQDLIDAGVSTDLSPEEIKKLANTYQKTYN